MTTAKEYVAKVGDELPRWYPERTRVLEDLRAHLADRVAAGENEEDVVGLMESPQDFARDLAEGLRLVPASIARRAGAFLVDALGFPLLFLGLPLLAGRIIEGPSTVVGGLGWGELMVVSLPPMNLLILSVIYFPIAESIFGTTVGKHLFGLGVVVEDGMRVTWSRSILRHIPFIVTPILPIDLVFALFSSRRQRAFDRVARTLVVIYPTRVAT